ncbi:MAG: glycosyltransferase family 39 protein [Acidobacteria bacterium]|nr:glycosyltransferase family 39 protein [Acidobacteriota bacterium]
MRFRPYLWLFVAAVLLYLPGIPWGLPHANDAGRIAPWGPDELAPLAPAAELYNVFIARRPPFNPQYPLFHYFVVALFVGPYLAWLWLMGALSAVSTVYPFGLSDPVGALRTMTLLGRLPSTLMAAGIVVVSAWTGRKLWGPHAGWMAGLFVAVLYPMGFYGRTANVDVPALFWIACGYAVVALSLRDGWTVRRGLLLGLFAALATATKDASYTAFVVPGTALLFLPNPAGRRKPNLALFGAGALAYAVASGVLFHAGRFLDHLYFITHGPDVGAYFIAPPSPAGYASLVGETGRLLADSMGWPLLLLAIWGILCVWKEDRRLLVLAGVLPCLLLLIVFPVRFVLLRFVLPSAWVLALFAARGALDLWQRRPLLGRVATVLSLGWALAFQADLYWQSYHDTRYAASEWFRLHAKPGDRVVYFDIAVKIPHLPDGVLSIKKAGHGDALSEKPEFVLLIPWEAYEPVREKSMTLDFHRALLDGSAGYRQAAHFAPRSWFNSRPISIVNPPVTVFVWADRH